MIVTRSRLHAVRFKLAVDKYLGEKGYPYGALVAFSGKVVDPDGGAECTEAGMNGMPETQTAAAFHHPDYRIMVCAEKFQTGFDEPLLHTMYVDKKLGGVNAVQTLSRLNRTHPDKQETMVLDFRCAPTPKVAAWKQAGRRTFSAVGTSLIDQATNSATSWKQQSLRLVKIYCFTLALHYTPRLLWLGLLAIRYVPLAVHCFKVFLHDRQQSSFIFIRMSFTGFYVEP